MATVADVPKAARPTDVTMFDRLLAVGALILFLAAVVALIRGSEWWSRIPFNIWTHLLTILIATGLTPVMLLRRRGDRLHRSLGYVWVVAMALTAATSLTIQTINPGSFSLIHILSIWTLIQVPLIVWRARQHDIVRHRSAVRGMVVGALLIAGFFTFPFDRMLGQMLLG